MRLLSCHVENFGVLHDFFMEFAPDYHCVCESNGFGKSTLTAFIRVMFYGFLGETKRNALENERKRFSPWQGGVYGGNISFEVKGKKYLLSRVFHDKVQNDEFSLRDLDTNLISRDYTENIGEEIFSVDYPSFMRTVFIGQNDLVTNATDDINAKIGNLTDNTNDLNSFEDADKRLTDLINGLNPRRKTGSVYKLKEQETELDTQIRALFGIDEAIEKQNEFINQTKKDIESLKSEQKEIAHLQAIASRKKDILSKKEMYAHLCAEAENKERDYRAKAEALKKDLPDKDTLSAMSKLQSKADEISMKINAKKDSGMESGRPGAVGAVFIVMICVGILLLLIGVFSLTAHKMSGCLFLILGLIVCCIGAVLFFQDTKRKQQSEKEIQELLVRYDALIEEIGAYLAGYGMDCAIDGYHQAIADLTQRVSSETAALGVFEKTYLDAEKKKQQFEIQNDVLFHEDTGDVQDLEELNNAYRICSEKLEKQYQNLREYQSRMEYLQEQAETLEEKQQKLDELHQTISKKTMLYSNLQKTQLYLKQAKENMTQKYVAPLKKHFEEYCQLITGDLEDEYFMDANAKITINKCGMQRETDYLSTGYRDLIGLCMRLAFADAMYPDEKPMLILDDPFANLDIEKMNGGKKLLDNMSKKYQIIYFTCHASRNEKI